MNIGQLAYLKLSVTLQQLLSLISADDFIYKGPALLQHSSCCCKDSRLLPICHPPGRPKDRLSYICNMSQETPSYSHMSMVHPASSISIDRHILQQAVHQYREQYSVCCPISPLTDLLPSGLLRLRLVLFIPRRAGFDVECTCPVLPAALWLSLSGAISDASWGWRTLHSITLL